MKLGIIGTGNMGSSILKGVTSSNFLENKNITIFDLNKEKIEELSKEYGVKKSENENELAKESDILILSVKPNIVPKVLDKIKDDLSEKTIVLSIAAGISIDFIENIIGTDKKVIRTMPNTPAQVMEGMTAVSFNQNIQENEKSIIFKLLNSFGKSIEIEEKQGTKQHDFNRFEIVMRDEKANSFFKQIAKSGMLKEKSISVLNNYFSVFETDEMINYWDKWESLIQGSMQFRFETVKKRKTVEKKFAYLCSTASNTLAVVIKAKEKAKELGLESSEYDTVQEILSYKTISKEEEESLVNDYIEKKKSIKENMY